MNFKITEKDFVGDVVDFFEKASHRYGKRKLFDDYLDITTCLIGKRVNNDLNMSEQFDHLVKKYNNSSDEEILNYFTKITEILSKCMLNNVKDYLGEVYTRLGFTNAKAGQFFTPNTVAEFMAEMTLSEKDIESESKPVTINDPCCGCGNMLLAALKVASRKGLNYPTDILLVAQDIDPVMTKIATIQFNAAGASAIVITGDSLLNRIEQINYTIGFVLVSNLIPGYLDKIDTIFKTKKSAKNKDSTERGFNNMELIRIRLTADVNETFKAGMEVVTGFELSEDGQITIQLEDGSETTQITYNEGYEIVDEEYITALKDMVKGNALAFTVVSEEPLTVEVKDENGTYTVERYEAEFYKKLLDELEAEAVVAES